MYTSHVKAPGSLSRGHDVSIIRVYVPLINILMLIFMLFYSFYSIYLTFSFKKFSSITAGVLGFD